MSKSLIAAKFAVCVMVIAPPALLLADCPDGTRPTSAEEQKVWLAEMAALKAALPQAQAGWQLDAPALFTSAPSSVCKGLHLVAGYDATYTSAEIRKQNQERERQFDARINEVKELPADKQKEADDLYRQASQLGYKSIAEVKNKNQAEADRLRAEANKLYAASKAIRTAYFDSVGDQIKAITDEQLAAHISPDVKVHLLVRDEPGDWNAAGKTDAHLPGVAKAYYATDHSLLLALGPVADGHRVWVRLEGARQNVETIARTFAAPRSPDLAATAAAPSGTK